MVSRRTKRATKRKENADKRDQVERERLENERSRLNEQLEEARPIEEPKIVINEHYYSQLSGLIDTSTATMAPVGSTLNHPYSPSPSMVAIDATFINPSSSSSPFKLDDINSSLDASPSTDTSSPSTERTSRVDRLPIPTKPFSYIYIELLRGLRLSGEYDSVLLIIDRYTNAIDLLPCPKTQNFDDITRLLLGKFVAMVGPPKSIVINPSIFESEREKWESFTNGQSITTEYSTEYIPPNYETTVAKVEQLCSKDLWHETIRLAGTPLLKVNQ